MTDIIQSYRLDYKPKNIIEFWFAEKNKSKWFNKDDDFDKEIIEKFLDIYNAASEGLLDHWQKSANGILALIIVLDQFPRNMFRNLAKSFITDSKALSLTKYALLNKMDQELNLEQKHFLYMPMMHSENLEDQKLSVQLFLNQNTNLESQNSDYAKMHMDIIEKFGRFPHRNNILGRISTKEEIEFLKTKHSSF